MNTEVASPTTTILETASDLFYREGIHTSAWIGSSAKPA